MSAPWRAWRPGKAMSANEQTLLETTRQLAALYQITAAIEHFHKHDWECAITLAGAAEGILPDAEEEDEVLFRRLKKDMAEHAEKLDLNFVQNWLKHGKYNGRYIESMRISEFIAVISLWRAITKFAAVYRKETPEMEEFLIWSRDNGYPAPTKRNRKQPPLILVR
jgi:hypothetical protein